mmetsp:Transcript_59599/g.174338  ORF Transcript_59599/g.174338 Transcript_59599/m.174338 type:complete len:345 (+) Transcript_59599:1516-2550(+)
MHRQCGDRASVADLGTRTRRRSWSTHGSAVPPGPQPCTRGRTVRARRQHVFSSMSATTRTTRAGARQKSQRNWSAPAATSRMHRRGGSQRAPRGPRGMRRPMSWGWSFGAGSKPAKAAAPCWSGPRALEGRTGQEAQHERWPSFRRQSPLCIASRGVPPLVLRPGRTAAESRTAGGWSDPGAGGSAAEAGRRAHAAGGPRPAGLVPPAPSPAMPPILAAAVRGAFAAASAGSDRQGRGLPRRRARAAEAGAGREPRRAGPRAAQLLLPRRPARPARLLPWRASLSISCGPWRHAGRVAAMGRGCLPSGVTMRQGRFGTPSAPSLLGPSLSSAGRVAFGAVSWKW